MNWRLGLSRIALALWIPWAAFYLWVALNSDSPSASFRHMDAWIMLFGPIIVFAAFAWGLGRIIEGFKAPE